jgi:plastocyanin
MTANQQTQPQSTQPDSNQAMATTQWMRLARAAALVMAVWSVLLQVAIGILIPPVLIIGLVFLAFVPFLKGDRRRLGLGYAIFTVVVLLGNVPVIVDDLTRIDSAPTFILAVASVLAGVLAIVAGFAAFFGRQTAALRALATAAVAIVAIGAVASIVVSANAANDLALDGDVEVIAQKILFDPDALVIDTGTTGVWIDNKDGVYHTFTIEELGVDVEIPALKARRVNLDAVPGTYTYICTIPGHENMTGTLTVEG